MGAGCFKIRTFCVGQASGHTIGGRKDRSELPLLPCLRMNINPFYASVVDCKAAVM